MSDHIKKVVDLKASVDRVWRAVTDHKEFGEWFKVDLDQPFVEGQVNTGQVTYPGCDHLEWWSQVEKITPQSYFAMKWCPYPGEPGTDYSKEAHTLIEFKLEATDTGTRLTIIESGFDSIPADKDPEECHRRNTGGWDAQSENIQAHVEG